MLWVWRSCPTKDSFILGKYRQLLSRGCGTRAPGKARHRPGGARFCCLPGQVPVSGQALRLLLPVGENRYQEEL